MKDYPVDPPSLLFATIYCIAAIAGGLGGCAAASYYFTHTKQSRLPFAVAYVVLGIAFGVVSIAVMLAYNLVTLDSIDKVVLYALLSGAAGSIALASANFSAKAYFKRLGVEVQVTLRKPDEDRRRSDED